MLGGMIRKALVLLALALAARGDEIQFDIKAGERKLVTLPSKVDDSHFSQPVGYTGHGTNARVFTKQITLTNTGNKELKGRLLTVNGRVISDMESLKDLLGPGDGRVAIERLFSFWRDHRSHAGSGSALASEPFAALNFWGFTLCGDDTLAFAKLAQNYGIDARYVQLNGHIAGEYFYENGWHLVDGDQNACYLRLDNQTLASADDVRDDPFLALRTKVFGKHGPMSRASAAMNTSLLERILPKPQSPIHIKVGPAPLNIFTLLPGESLIWHATAPPENVVGELNAEKPGVLKDAALATLEHRVSVAQRARSEKGILTVRGAYPISRVVNETTGETVVPKSVVFKADIPVKADSDQVAVIMQCSQFALPLLSKGVNTATLEATNSTAHVTYEYEPFPKAVLPDLRVVPTEKTGRFPGEPAFNITTKPAADSLWWQISAKRDFSFVPPNFDVVMPAVPVLKFDALTQTFFSPGRTYYLRVRAHAGDLWGEWSPGIEFRVTKPGQPLGGRFSDAGAGQVQLTWIDLADEYLVFASNRLDFLPDVMGAEEIVAMNGTNVTEKRPNKNLIATVKTPEFEFLPQYRYYRVIAKKGSTLSVPSPLWKLPEEWAAKLPPGVVLQARVSTNKGEDEYIAHEEKLLPPPPPKPAPAPEKAGDPTDNSPKTEDQKPKDPKPDQPPQTTKKPKDDKAPKKP